MYAILKQGGHQYRVTPGDRLLVDRLPAAVGTVIALEPVLLVQDADRLTTNAGELEGARLAATVVSHRRGPKLRVYKYKAKKRYRRTQGHRSDLTELRVMSLLQRGEALPEPGPTPAAVRAARTAPATGRTSTKKAVTEAASAPATEPKQTPGSSETAAGASTEDGAVTTEDKA